MNKLKPIAYELINLKNEFNNMSYSHTIRQALELSIDQMLEKEFIDLNTHLYIKDMNVSIEEFEKYLNETDKYRKNIEELKAEYLQLNNIIKSEMIGLGLNKQDIRCKLNLDKEKIRICKIFRLESDFLKKYFYFENSDSEDIDKLMKRRGFVERFVTLRFPRILMNFIESCGTHPNFNLEKTYPHFDSNKNCYAIELVFDIDISKLEDESSRKVILEDILPIIHNAQVYFADRMSV